MRIADLGLFYDSIGLIAVLFDLVLKTAIERPDHFDLQFFMENLGQYPF